VLNGLLFVLIALVVVPFVVYALPSVVGAEHSFVVLSGSMEPAMSPGDVVVDGVGPANVEEGDVITFVTSESEPPTTHRVIDVVETNDGGRAFRTKGDANEDPDQELVEPQQVIGGVAFVIPYVGHVVGFVNTPVGFALLVLAPLGLLALSEFYAIVSTSDDDQDDPDDGSDPPSPSADADLADAPPVPESPVVNEPVAAAGDSTEAESADDDGGFALSRGELRFALGVLAPVVPYSALVAYRIREGWAVTAAVAAALSLLFAAMAYRNTSASDDKTIAAGGTPVVSGQIPQTTDRERVEIGSIESLVRMAADGGDWLFADDDGYYLLREDRVYVHDRATDDLLTELSAAEAERPDEGGDGS
jgi:signal peptidase